MSRSTASQPLRRETRLGDDGRDAVDGDADEEVVREPLAAVEHGLLHSRIDRDDTRLRRELDFTLRELVEKPLRDLGRDRHRRRHRRQDAELCAFADPAVDEQVVQEERALERRGRAFEGLAEDPDQDGPAGETGQRVAQPLGAGDRVVLVSAVRKSRRRVDVVFGAERHDEDVGVVSATIGRHASRRRVHRGHGLLAELDSGLGDLAVRELRGRRIRPAEEDVELREAEREAVVAVDQCDLNLSGELGGEATRQLEASEPRAEDDNLLHAGTIRRARSAELAAGRLI